MGFWWVHSSDSTNVRPKVLIESINSCIVSSYSGTTGGTLSSSTHSCTSLQSVRLHHSPNMSARLKIIDPVLSILIVVQIAMPSSGMPPISLAVWIVMMAVNIVFTGQIAGRILFHRRKLVDALGPEHASMYTGMVAIVIESALPFTVISIVLLGLFGDNNTAQNLFISLLLQLEVCVFYLK